MQKTIADHFQTQPVLKAWLFGFFARGEEMPLSDIDTIVMLDHSQPVGLRFFDMWNDREQLPDRKVDLNNGNYSKKLANSLDAQLKFMGTDKDNVTAQLCIY